MKKFVVFGLLAALVFCLPAAAQVRFKDMPDNHWAASAVYDLVKRGITDGFPDGTFRGNETLTRYQTAVFLNKMANSIEKKIVSRSEIQRMIARSGGGAAAGGSGVSGVVYFAYEKNLQNSGIVNNFDIERVYVNIKNKLGGNAKSRVTFDISRAGGTANLYSYLKYAYVDLQDALPAELQLVPTNLNVRIGLLPTYWIGYVDKILGIRYVSKNLNDLNGVLSSADFGVGANGSVNLAGLKVKFDGAVINGAGYKSTETNSSKTINLRANAEVVDGVEVAVGGQLEDIGSSGTGPKLVNGLVAYKGDLGAAYLEALYGKGALGVSLGGIYEVLPAINVFGRLDSYDPNRSASNDQTTTVIGGASYDWGSNVKLAADVKSMTTGTANAVAVAELRTQIKF